jgi:hypothetical protein
VYVWVCLYARARVPARVCLCACVCVCVCAYMCVLVRVRVCMCLYLCTLAANMANAEPKWKFLSESAYFIHMTTAWFKSCYAASK